MGQQTKSTKSKPRKRRNDGGNRVVFIIAAVLMVIYLGGRLSNAFSAAPETTPALHVTVNDSFTSDGWFFRDEEPIDNATGSSVKHIVYSGERVQQDAPLAIIYSDQESMDLSRQLDPLEERISLLDTALQSTSDSSNIAKLVLRLALRRNGLHLQPQSAQQRYKDLDRLRVTLDAKKSTCQLPPAVILAADRK